MSPLAREELENVIQPTWTDAAVAVLVFAAGAFTVGYQLAQWREQQKPPRIEYRQAPAPLSQWKCNGRERAEYFEACKQRKLSELTKPRGTM